MAASAFVSWGFDEEDANMVVIRNYAGIVQRLIMVDGMQEYMHTKAPYGHTPLVNLTIFVYGSTDLLV